jgi:hypothetical protein
VPKYVPTGVISLAIPNEAPPSQKLASLAVQRVPCLQTPLSMAVIASSMSPAVPGRRFGATAPGPRRVAIISGPTGGRRCLRHGALLKRGPGVCSSWSRSGSFNGMSRPGVARELPFKSHFKGEAEFNGPGSGRATARNSDPIQVASSRYNCLPAFPHPSGVASGLRPEATNFKKRRT